MQWPPCSPPRWSRAGSTTFPDQPRTTGATLLRTFSTDGSCTATPTGSTAPNGRRTTTGSSAAAAQRFDAEHALRKALDVVRYGLAHDLLRSTGPHRSTARDPEEPDP